MQHIICLFGVETLEWTKRDLSQSQEIKMKFLSSIKKQTEGIGY
jgi:hypothetical protein